MERKSLFGAQSRSWTPLENEFLAENELIEIVPNFSCPKREFIQVTHAANTLHIRLQITNPNRAHLVHFDQQSASKCHYG